METPLRFGHQIALWRTAGREFREPGWARKQLASSDDFVRLRLSLSVSRELESNSLVDALNSRKPKGDSYGQERNEETREASGTGENSQTHEGRQQNLYEVSGIAVISLSGEEVFNGAGGVILTGLDPFCSREAEP